MNSDPIVSVIMPVYNMAEYLNDSIASWVNQTMPDIEILCIDDASTDSSLQVLREWAKKDERIRIFVFETNQSAWTARKLGIEKALGKYILFADADDVISENACEELSLEMQTSPVDILHFNAEIVNVNGLSQSRIKSMEKFVAPCKGSLYGKQILTACFYDDTYRFSLWNKMFRADLCKKAFADQKDAYLPKGQDKLTYFLLAFYAESYRGLADKTYYHYYFGRGGTGLKKMNVPQFERYCAMAKVGDTLRDFLEKRELLELYCDIEKKFRDEMLNDCAARWCSDLADEDKAHCFDLMVKYWGSVDTISAIVKREFYNRYAVSRQLEKAASIQYNGRKVKTIAAYYHSICNGGLQRVLCTLCALWVQMGYRVIVLTDQSPEKEDYPLPSCVERIVIPNYTQMNPNTYAIRAEALNTIIREKQIDAVVYHAWILNLMLWDELVIKTAGAAFVAHCHNIFSLSLFSGWDRYGIVVAPYLSADAVITLSEVDAHFWKHINGNVFQTINPFTGKLSDWKTSLCKNHNVLFIGRISSEKRPEEAIRIIEKVRVSVPDAKLHIVGTSNQAGYMEQFRKAIIWNNLQDHVILHGFHKNVMKYYQKASVFLSTSSYEGYPLTLQESMMAGLPAVIYELPYVTLVRGNPGIISVKQMDSDAAADAIIELFQDDERRIQMGKANRERIRELEDFDFRGLWESVFDSLTQPKKVVPDTERIMMETMISHLDTGLQKVKKQGEKAAADKMQAALSGGEKTAGETQKAPAPGQKKDGTKAPKAEGSQGIKAKEAGDGKAVVSHQGHSGRRGILGLIDLFYQRKNKK